MLSSLLSRIITKIKGEDFQLSKDIPTGYFLSMLISKIFMYLRGLFIFFNPNRRIFVGPKVILKAIRLIKGGRNLSIARNCYIDALSKNGIQFGNNVSIGKSTTIECTGSLKQIGEGLSVGNNVGLGTHGFFGCAGGVEIGSDTIFGNFVSLHSENHNFSDLDIPIRLQGINRQGIKIGSNCWIGAKVTILDGVKIENGCIIAAGSLLTSGVYKENGIYGGIPAKQLKNR